MRISMVIGTLERGGAEHQLVGLAENFSSFGQDVEVITLQGGGPLQARLATAGIPVISLGPSEREWRIPKVSAAGDLLAVSLRLRAHLRRWRPDVVHAWLPEAQVIALPIARRLGVPVRVLSLRSLRSGARGGYVFDQVFGLAAASATLITANSHSVAADKGWCTGRHDRVVIHNGLSLPKECADVTRQPPRGVVVANLLAYKGHKDLLSALAMSSSRPRIALIGDGPEYAELIHHAYSLGVRDRVDFLGSLADPMSVLLESQFSVLASHTEGLPNAVLEAMGAGLPVIATDVGGVQDLISHERNGIIVPPRDPQALSLEIDKLVQSSENRKRLGSAARSSVSHFDWESISSAYLRLYSEAKP